MEEMRKMWCTLGFAAGLTDKPQWSQCYVNLPPVLYKVTPTSQINS